jgi:predicted acylesterase/phospholipase RssA
MENSKFKSTHTLSSSGNLIISSFERKFDAVCLGGGGSKGILTLGALQKYYEDGLFDPNFTSIYIGTSIGSVINLLLVCGFIPIEIFTEFCTMGNLIDVKDFNNLSAIFEMGGMVSINVLSDKISALVEKKIKLPPYNWKSDKLPTLKELYELTIKLLIITAANVSEIKCEYWSYKNYPDLNCIEAIENACRIPILFPRKYFTNQNNDLCYAVDGAFMDNFPLQYIDDGKIKILGIVISGEPDLSQSDEHYLTYFHRLLAMPIRANTELRCQLAGENTTLIKINYEDAGLFEVNMSKEKKMDMFLHGFKTAEKL